MRQSILSYAAKFLVGVFILVVVFSFFQAISSHPTEGDSLAYHIPIAKSVLTGTVFRPTFYLGFYPSNAEIILAALIFLHIPLNLFNVLASVVLFFICFRLGKIYKLSYNFSLIFAVSICLLHTILRWTFAQIIDIWLLNFFLGALILFEYPKKNNWHIVLLGVFCGLLIGTKYTGIFFVLVLLGFYWRARIKKNSIIKVALFLFPVFVFGIFWFLRNYIVIGNPFYPQASFLFPKSPTYFHIFAVNVWEAIIRNPILFVNAMIAEFLLWPIISIFLIIIAFRKQLFFKNLMLKRVLLIGSVCFLFFLFLPTNYEYNIIVSSFRYAYPAFILFFLGGFIIAQKLKLELLIVLFVCASVAITLIPPYHPKILFFVLPLLALFYRLLLFIEQKRILD